MKLNQVVVQVISADDADGLTIAVNNFIKSIGEATLLATHFAIVDGQFAAMIVYTN
jgi:hypothetical protein